MNLTVIESPYAGDVKKNIRYARLCVKHSLALGEAPIASHLLYTQSGILDDNQPDERELGIRAGLHWHRTADVIAFYEDYGWSKGMTDALKHAQMVNPEAIKVRKIFSQTNE